MGTFVSAGILVSLLLRESKYRSTTAVLLYRGRRGYSLFLSSLAVTGVTCVLEGGFGKVTLCGTLGGLGAFFSIIDLATSGIRSTLVLRTASFRSTLRCFSTTGVRTSIVIAEGRGSFCFSRVDVASPGSFLRDVS